MSPYFWFLAREAYGGANLRTFWLLAGLVAISPLAVAVAS